VSKIKDFICKKRTAKEYMILLVCVGLLIFIFMIPVKDKKSPVDSENRILEQISTGNTDMEQKLANALSSLEGVGEVQVMITYHDGETDWLGESEEGNVYGILVICGENMESDKVLLIHDVIQVLFPVETHKIKVVKGRVAP